MLCTALRQTPRILYRHWVLTEVKLHAVNKTLALLLVWIGWVMNTRQPDPEEYQSLLNSNAQLVVSRQYKIPFFVLYPVELYWDKGI